jgi:hypothetical protein
VALEEEMSREWPASLEPHAPRVDAAEDGEDRALRASPGELIAQDVHSWTITKETQQITHCPSLSRFLP